MEHTNNTAASYTSLVENVLSVPALANKVSQIADTTNYLNLITPDWRARMENSVFYQRFLNHNHECFGQLRPLKSKNDPNLNLQRQYVTLLGQESFNVILAVKCRIDENMKGFSIYTLANEPCEPLSMIVRAMTSDVPANVEPYNSIKVFMSNCSPLKCRSCSSAAKNYEKQNVKFSKEEPCICYTTLFDGKDVVNRFGSSLRFCFSRSSFIAVVAIKINQRNFFTRKLDRFKVVSVGGSLDRILAFDECKLMKNVEEPVTIGYLGSITEECENVYEEMQPIPLEEIYDPNPVEAAIRAAASVNSTATTTTVSTATGEDDGRLWYEGNEIDNLMKWDDTIVKRCLETLEEEKPSINTNEPTTSGKRCLDDTLENTEKSKCAKRDDGDEEDKDALVIDEETFYLE